MTRLWMILLAIPVLAVAVLLNANTTAGVPAPPVTFKGLEHTPLGAATLTPVGDTLVVGNIGSNNRKSEICQGVQCNITSSNCQ